MKKRQLIYYTQALFVSPVFLESSSEDTESYTEIPNIYLQSLKIIALIDHLGQACPTTGLQALTLQTTPIVNHSPHNHPTCIYKFRGLHSSE